MFGLAPLVTAARVPIGLVLKTSSANTTADRRKTRTGQAIVAVQIALCLVLLVGGGLLVRTLQNLNAADLGFRTSGLLVFGVTPPQTVRGDEAVARFYQSLMTRLRTLPGVEAATVMSNRIGSGWSNNTAAVVDSQPPDAQKFSPMRWNAVGPDYFHVLGTPLLLGRDFTESDGSSAPPVVIVNETFVQRYLPNRQPLGHQVSLLILSVIGIGVGLPLAIAGARLLKAMLFDITAGDRISFAAALGGIGAVAIGASLIPASRAASVNPIVALRYE
jgi:hypothetical protein